MIDEVAAALRKELRREPEYLITTGCFGGFYE